MHLPLMILEIRLDGQKLGNSSDEVCQQFFRSYKSVQQSDFFQDHPRNKRFLDRGFSRASGCLGLPLQLVHNITFHKGHLGKVQ